VLTRILFATLGVAVLCAMFTIYWYTRFSITVSERLDGDFKNSARIYAAVPDDIPPTALALRNASASESEDEPGLMTNFFDADRARQRIVEFDGLPRMLVRAVLAGEDRTFFHHYGLSPKRIVAAFVFDMKQGETAQGASTITQQLARTLFLTREPTLRRKLSEAMIALILERRLTKEQIFTMYSNEVYLGQRESFAIHGFGEAAMAYFGKDLQDLTLAEAATLAGIIPAPNAYSPVQHPERAIARRALILRTLHDTDEISDAEYKEADKAAMKIAPSLDSTEGHYLVDFIREELRHDFSETALLTDGMKVQTTVDIPLQRAAMEAVAHGVAAVEAELAKRKRPAHPAPQAGLIALDPRTGEIKAMVGGTRYGESQYNRITAAMRQPGSIFKPIVYAAALETAQDLSRFDLNPGQDEGAEYITPASLIIDEPTEFGSPGQVYIPKNYGGQYLGPVALRTAFQRSLNVPAVRVARAIGYDRVVRMARRLGLNPQIRAYPSVALGAFEVTPIEMAGAYTAFANGGRRVEPHAIRRVTTDIGLDLKTYDAKPTSVISPQLAYVMTHLMEGVLNYGTGAGVRARGFTLPAAGKTGTSRDGWFVGYTKDLLVIAWVGFDDGQDLNLEGARSALPIWAEFMKKAYQIHPVRDMSTMNFIPPTGIEFANIDIATLARGDASCGESFDEAFFYGTAPSAYCGELSAP
jgi:penicillin-binding protein 1B